MLERLQERTTRTEAKTESEIRPTECDFTTTETSSLEYYIRV